MQKLAVLADIGVKQDPGGGDVVYVEAVSLLAGRNGMSLVCR